MFATAMSFTPGPNTMLATALAANFGLRRTLRFIVAVPAGWTLMMLASGLGLGALVSALPGLRGLIQGGRRRLPRLDGVAADGTAHARPRRRCRRRSASGRASACSSSTSRPGCSRSRWPAAGSRRRRAMPRRIPASASRSSARVITRLRADEQRVCARRLAAAALARASATVCSGSTVRWRCCCSPRRSGWRSRERPRRDPRAVARAARRRRLRDDLADDASRRRPGWPTRSCRRSSSPPAARRSPDC